LLDDTNINATIFPNAPLTTHAEYLNGAFATVVSGGDGILGAAGNYSASWTINDTVTWKAAALTFKPHP